MTAMTRRAFGASGFAVLLAASVSFAQQPQTFRIRAQIEKVDGSVLTVKVRAGATQKIKLADNVRVAAMIKATLDELKPNTYIGITAMPQADGSQKAVAIHIFQENQRGAGEGHRPWDLMPNSTMTNAAIETTVASTDGQVLIKVKYKQGDKMDEKKIIVTPQTSIVRYLPGNKDELKPGVHIIVGAATRAADGYETAALNFGRDGIIPPM